MLESNGVARHLRSMASKTLDLEEFEVLTFAADKLDGHAIAETGGTCSLVPVVVDLTFRLRRAETALVAVVAERDEILDAIAQGVEK